jgi:2-polyprenyl-6-methoxyphenol hydroxylase-like FAD-dependent oxidoreductase
MLEEQVDVLVVGGGVGGGALSLALGSSQPLRVMVVERRSGPANVNRGDSLLPVVTSHFAAWGALDRLHSAGARAVHTMVVSHPERGVVLEAPLTPEGAPYPYLVLPHPDIERVLAEAAIATGRVEIRYRTRVARLMEERGRVCGAVLADEAGNEREVRAALVVGADGSTSSVRAALGIELPTEPYDHDFYVIDLDGRDDDENLFRVHLHPSGGVLAVPGPNRLGLAVLVRPEDEALFRAGPLEEKLAAISARAPMAKGRAAKPGAHLYKVSRGHADRYVARGAALMGDAVHVTNPTAGQGMTMAVEDAASLARIIGPALASGRAGTDLDSLLVAYERDRRPKNAGLIWRSHWMSRFYSFGGDWGDRVRKHIFALGGSPVGRAIHRTIWNSVAQRRSA